MQFRLVALAAITLVAAMPSQAQVTVPSDSLSTGVSAGKFRKVYDPGIGEEKNWYINDHCFIRGADGTWHMYGITHAEPLNPMDEKHFAHASAKKLTQEPWQKHPFALSWSPEDQERHLWAPYVLEHKGTYYMYYCAGGPKNSEYRIHLAISKDLKKWTRHPENPMLIDGFDARDPMVVRVGDKWVMYYTANSEPTGGNHVVAFVTSDDLVHWHNKGVAFTDPNPRNVRRPGAESPFVVRRGRTVSLHRTARRYNGNRCFRSKGSVPLGHFPEGGAHPSLAAEVCVTRRQVVVSRADGGGWSLPRSNMWNDGAGRRGNLDHPRRER